LQDTSWPNGVQRFTKNEINQKEFARKKSDQKQNFSIRGRPLKKFAQNREKTDPSPLVRADVRIWWTPLVRNGHPSDCGRLPLR